MPEAAAIPAGSGLRVEPIAYPLDEFYAQASRILPKVSAVEAAEIPEPARSLLAHEHDMTPTLAAFYKNPVTLRVLSRQHRNDHYFREVLLFAGDENEPVEFGAIKISLGLLPPAARRAVLDEKLPFGQVLEEFRIPHTSRPKAFLRLKADEFMTSSLRLSVAGLLFGRRNTLFDGKQRPLAEIVEILPPWEKPGQGEKKSDV